jgi:hypothetical protein
MEEPTSSSPVHPGGEIEDASEADVQESSEEEGSFEIQVYNEWSELKVARADDMFAQGKTVEEIAERTAMSLRSTKRYVLFVDSPS